jgi:hypothetical protein
VVVASDSAAIAAVSVASLVIGYGLLAGLWYFVFSPGAERRARRREQASAGRPPGEDAPPGAAERHANTNPEAGPRARPWRRPPRR